MKLILIWISYNSKPPIRIAPRRAIQQMIDVALKWQKLAGVAPAITSALTEYGPAMLVGCSRGILKKLRKHNSGDYIILLVNN